VGANGKRHPAIALKAVRAMGRRRRRARAIEFGRTLNCPTI
jgi:hypothetical protein